MRSNQELSKNEVSGKVGEWVSESSDESHSRTHPLTRSPAFWFSICIVACFSAFAAPVKIELPAETAVFKPGPGAELANGQCLVCHSVEYVAMQPQSPRPFWAASVKKMREKYGATVPDDQVEVLLDYLTKHYGVPTTNSTPSAATNAAPKAVGSATALSGEAVAAKYFCILCHDVSVKKVGPPFKDIAAKYRAEADALAKVVDQVRNGGSGKWGPVVMPPFPMVSEAETKAVAEWILSQK